MKTVIFSTRKFEEPFIERANKSRHELIFLETRLTKDSASLAKSCQAVSLFVNDDASAPVLELLHQQEIHFIVLRSAGFNNVDLTKARHLDIRVARVPAYSPYAVAEHAVALMLALNRKLIRAHNRILDFNFSLDALTGFDMHGKSVGIIGTGKIGSIMARILYGLDCRLLAFDTKENEEIKKNYQVEYTDCRSLFRQSDIITLHVPLTAQTRHLINKSCIDSMKHGVMLINTGRGALDKTNDVVTALKDGRIGYFGMDVYEEEEGLFFENHSDDILQDDTIARLMTFQNVLNTSHQGFLTDTALKNIAEITIDNLSCFEKNTICKNDLTKTKTI